MYELSATLVILQREVTTRTEALRVKMLSEDKVALLQGELDFAQQALTCSQAECSSIKKQLSRKVHALLSTPSTSVNIS